MTPPSASRLPRPTLRPDSRPPRTNAAQDALGASEHLVAKLMPRLAPFMFAYAIFQIALYRRPWASVPLLAGCVGLLAVPAAARRFGVSNAWLGAGVLYVTLGLTSYARGGLLPAVVLWHLVVPFGTYLMGRRRLAVVYTALALAQVALLWLLQARGWAPPLSTTSPFGAGSAVVGVVLVLGVTIVLQRHLRTRARSEADELRARLARLQRMESVARLAGGVAHDFNNLLAVVAAHGEALRERADLDPTGVEDVEAILEATRSGATLTRQLLAAARERPSEALEVLDLRRQLVETVGVLRKVLRENIDIHLDDATTAHPVEGDRWEVEQVILHLALNAQDAMPDGGSLRLRLQDRRIAEPMELLYGTLQPGTYAVLTVQDEGGGMAPEVLEHAVEPYFTTRQEHGGSGMGLAVVHGVVLRSGGQLHAHSDARLGTTVTLYLPRSTAALTPERPAAPSLVSSARRILLVEDDPAVRRAMARLLRLDGHEVVQEEDGAAGWRWVQEHRDAFDVLLTDLVMPGLSGRELALRARSLRPDLPVVFMSGYAGEAAPSAEEVPHGVFLSKPVRLEDLRRALEQVVEAPAGPPADG
jgi:signal transduction histidine kinase/ActR/RegA family two-component response regulator